MSGCDCSAGASQLAKDKSRRRTLVIVLLINAIMFVAVLAVGLWADSRALIADSADNLGDAMIYGLSILALGRSQRWIAGAALAKGMAQLAFGVLVIVTVVHGILTEPEPIGAAIMLMAAVALLANLSSFFLLLKHRGDDINMRSVWLCSRNDVISNVGVIITGLLVVVFRSPWPDLLVGGIIAAIFLQTAYIVLRDGWATWQQPPETS